MKLFRKAFNAAAVRPDPCLDLNSTKHGCDLQFAAKEWKDLPCPGVPRRVCAMTMWSTDKMIVAGGSDAVQQGRMLDSVEVYDFSKCEWTFLPSLNQPREEGVAIVVEEKLYVFGGFGTGSYIAECEVLDLCRPEGGFTRLRNDLPQPLKGAVAVSNGHWIYIIGGYHVTVGYLNTVFALDTNTLEWDDTFPSLDTPRHLPAVAVAGNSLVVAGGRSLGNRGRIKHLDSVECINLTKGTQWNYMAPMTSSRAGAVAFTWNDNVFVVGGELSNNLPATTLLRYDGIEWRQKPFRNAGSRMWPCLGTLLVSVSRNMTMISMDNPWDFKCLSCTSVKESDAFLKFDYKKLQRLEQDLQSQPSIEGICEFLRIFQLAMEWDEEHGSHQHGKIAVQIRTLLTQPHIANVLKGDIRCDSVLGNGAERNDFFVCDDDDDEEEGDDNFDPASDYGENACPDGLVPVVINFRSHFVDDDPSAMTMVDHMDDSVDAFDGASIMHVASSSCLVPDKVPATQVASSVAGDDVPPMATTEVGNVTSAPKVGNVTSAPTTITNEKVGDHIGDSVDALNETSPMDVTSSSSLVPDKAPVTRVTSSVVGNVVTCTTTTEPSHVKSAPTTKSTNKKVTVLPRVVSPDQGKGKPSKGTASTTKHPAKVPHRVVTPDHGRGKASPLKITDEERTVATCDSSFFGKQRQQARRIVFTAPSVKPAINLRAVESICDDDAEGMWV